VALVRDGRMTIGHVGDTRLYAVRGGVLRKVTHDHSPVGEREDQGEIGELEAMRHPRRNEIYRDVGSQHHEPADPEFIEILEMPFEQDTALVLCTDGLSDLVPSARIARTVFEHAADPTAAVERLIEAANEAGGKDNVTAVFVAAPGFPNVAQRELTAHRQGEFAERRTVRAGNRIRRALGTRAAWAAYGLLLGLAVAAALLFVTDAVPDALLRLSRPASWTRTWRVGATGEAEFATITDALQRAQPGDVVEVDPGSYDLPIEVPAGVHLVSRKPREAILRAPDGSTSREPAVSLSGRSRLAGFKIHGPRGVATSGDDEVVMEDLDVSGGDFGVAFGKGSRGVLRSSYIHDNPGIGVVALGPSLPTLMHNVIAGNGKGPWEGARTAEMTDPWPPAVLLREGAAPAFFGNIIAANAHDEIRGLATEKKADVVRDNMIGVPVPQRPAAPLPAPRRRVQ